MEKGCEQYALSSFKVLFLPYHERITQRLFFLWHQATQFWKLIPDWHKRYRDRKGFERKIWDLQSSISSTIWYNNNDNAEGFSELEKKITEQQESLATLEKAHALNKHALDKQAERIATLEKRLESLEKGEKGETA